MFQDEDSEGHCPAGSEGTEQGEGEGVEDQDHAGKMAERIRKFKRGKVDVVFGRECVQTRQACSVGVSPAGARARSPVAWITSVEETNLVKLIDKAIFGMVSESPGRNASEPIGGPVKNKLRRPSHLLTGEGIMTRRNLADAVGHSGGVVGAAR